MAYWQYRPALAHATLRHMFIYRRTLILSAAVIALGLAATTPVASAQPATADGCAVLPQGHRGSNDEWGTCLATTVDVHGLPRVGEQADVSIVIAASADRASVDIQVELPAQLAWVEAPVGLVARASGSRAPEDRAGVHRMGTVRPVKAGTPTVLTGRVRAVAAGPAHIRVNAATAAPEVASDSAFLTIGRDVTVAGFAAVTDDTAIPATSGAATRAYPQWPVKPVGASTTPGTTCADGSFGYQDTGGVNRIGANVGVQAWDSDAAGGDDLLASGVTDAAGTYRLCFAGSDEEGGGQDVYVVFSSDNGQWRIQHTTTKADYRFRTETTANVTSGSTLNLGARQPGNTALMRAVQAFDEVGAAWNWTPGTCWDARDAVCRKALVNWATDSTQGTWYDLNENAVFLLADDPRAAELVLHEFGHLIMDDLYEEGFPSSPKCSPHYIPRTSSRGCAWAEGFATLYEVMVLGQPIFRWADGRTLDVEQPTWGTADWDNGDRVEGRVLGSLIDLYDANNEGTYDRCTEDPRATIWTTMLNHKSTTFSQFWSDRASDGFDTSRTPLGCLYQNTIVYGGYRP